MTPSASEILILRDTIEKIVNAPEMELQADKHNYLATELHFAKYRKESDVAREIFDELKRTILTWDSQQYKDWYLGEIMRKYLGESK